MRKLILSALVCFVVGSPCVASPLLPPPVPVGSDTLWNGENGLNPFTEEADEASNYQLSILTTHYVQLITVPDYTAVELLEPESNSASDYIYSTGQHISLVSDLNGTFPGVILSTLTIIARIPETGQWQDISQYFGLSAGSLLVASDISETPLPATLPLLTSSLGALGLLSWRRKLKARAAF